MIIFIFYVYLCYKLISIKRKVSGGNFNMLMPIDDQWTFGLSVQNFFGLSLNWQDDWIGRYSSTKEWLIAPQIQPTIAYKVNDWLSVDAGLGFTVGYFKIYMKIYKPDTTPLDGKANFTILLSPFRGTWVQ